MAQIGAPHGIKGEVRVKTFGDDPFSLGDYGLLYAEDGRRFKISRMRPAKNLLVVKFKGINFRDEAEALNGIQLFIDRSALPDDTEDDEFYVSDLIGCTAVDEKEQPIGKVIAVPNFGAGDLVELSLTGSGKTQFLEFTRKNVPGIDLDKKIIIVHIPDEVSERDD